mmetsp:Transcript_33665/g.45810  ORF Transcript_33665/g.45810 Transcript_33665/m.45810 type:complete len:94 (+) Transcript_33665:163-444(+)
MHTRLKLEGIFSRPRPTPSMSSCRVCGPVTADCLHTPKVLHCRGKRRIKDLIQLIGLSLSTADSGKGPASRSAVAVTQDRREALRGASAREHG